MTVDTAGNLTARFREYLDEHIFTSLLQFDKSSDLNGMYHPVKRAATIRWAKMMFSKQIIYANMNRP